MTRDEFVAGCLALQGLPYRWGGKDPKMGLDCSGLVTWVAYVLGGRDRRGTHNSERLRLEWEELVEPQAGDVALYGPPKGPAVHVVVCLGGPHDRIIGANGGNRSVTTIEAAHDKRAFVKTHPSPHYRADLIGYRRNPWVDP
jgi:hypothetical protein